MSTIRPGLPPAIAPTMQPAPARAAQQAFFRAALDRAQAPTVEQTPVASPNDPPAADRLPRPGALLDIRV